MRIEQLTVNDIAREWPAALPLLEAKGIDACCGGAHTIAEAAAAHEVPLAPLLVELASAGVVLASEDPVVDVRTITPRDRHPLIFATFDGLPVGAALTLINDHDPRPLYYQFQAERTGQVSWEPQEEGPERWEIRIVRTA